MSNLPVVDPEKIARDLSTKLAETLFDLSAMKTLAEALLAERDELARQVAELQGDK